MKRKDIFAFIKELGFDFYSIFIVILCCYLWFDIFARAFGDYLCFNVSTCYSILLFIIGTTITLKLFVLNEKNKRKELFLFLLEIILNFVFILSAVWNDTASIYYVTENQTINGIEYNNAIQIINLNEFKKTVVILNGAIWINLYILLVNFIQSTKILIKKHFRNEAIIPEKKQDNDKIVDGNEFEQNNGDATKENSVAEMTSENINILEENKMDSNFDGYKDLFDYWLNNEENSELVKIALTDRSYKDIYRKENKCELDDKKTNYEMATYGDSILKMALLKKLNDDKVAQPSEVKKNYESDEVLVKYIAAHYNILSKIKYNKEKVKVENYDYDSNYIYDKNGKKKGNHCKFIATCVEALLVSIYEETHDFNNIIKIVNNWISIVDEAQNSNKKGE